jgi:hypothetical protein
MGPLRVFNCAPIVPSKQRSSIPPSSILCSWVIDEQETTSPLTDEEDGEQAVSNRRAITPITFFI